MNKKEIADLLRPLLENIPEDNDDVILLADGIVDNKLYVSNSLPIFNHQGLDSFDWNVNTGKSSNSFQLYLQSQVHLSILVCAYNITGNSEYINVADRYFESWVAYEQSDKSDKNALVWNDHSSAMRLISLLFYLYCAKDSISESELDLIEKHIEFIVDEKNYTPKANHGIFMDRSVLCACILLGGHETEKSIAVNRLKEQCEFAYLPDGAHSENSPAYQFYVWTALRALYDFLSKTDSTKGFEFLRDCCEKSDDFLAWFIQPDGKFAFVGDSDDDNLDASAYKGDNHGDLYNYFLSCGTEGKKPKKNYAYYENAGYYFARNFIDDTLKDTWFMFKAGAVTNVHKHADDLSILLSSKGYPIFIDCGRYNYVYGDKIRSYVTGVLAHNTVVVDGKTYSVCAQRVDRSKIIETDFSSEYEYIRGRNDGYDGVSIDRAVYRNNDTVLIHDDIIADSDHRYSQHFHLGENIEPISLTDREFVGRIADSGYVVRVTQLAGNTVSDIQNGSDVGSYLGIASNKMGEAHSINTLVFKSSNVKNFSFVTEITIEKEAENYCSCVYIPEEMQVNGNINVQLKQLKRDVIPAKVAVGAPEWEYTDSNHIKFNINCESKEDYFVHWLIYRDGGYYSYKYTKNLSEYVLELTEIGNYTLVYSVQTSDGDRQTWICDEINYPCDSGKYGFGIDVFSLFSNKLDEKSVIEVADQILCGELNVWNTMSAEPYHIWDIDWNITVAVSPDSYQMQLQGFRHVMYLTHAYEITRNYEYIAYAWRFLDSWNEYSKSEKSKLNPMCWNDHAMSTRADHIIYLLIICEKYNLLDEKKIALADEVLQKSAEYLCDPDYYTQKNNHGIYQDCALLYIAYFLKNEHSAEWVAIAKERLRAQFEHAFLPDMVHCENSPEYQITVIGLFKEAAKIFENANDSECEFYNEKLLDAARFLTYVTKPNGALAEIGDTDGRADDTFNPKNGFRDLKCSELDWATSLGAEGVKPEDNIAVFPYGGYCVYRSSWEKDEMADSVWFMFKSGYTSRIHKHGDDLHFMLNADGNEIFIDRGKYGYQIGDFTTEALHSAFGHNTVTVDSDTYPISSERGYMTGLLKREKQGEFNCFAGYNDSYDSVRISREIFFNDKKVFVIHDNIQSDKKHLYTQQFHLSEKAQVIASYNNELIAKIKGTSLIVRIRQLVDCDCKVIGEKDNNPEFGYRSRTFSNTTPCTSLLYSKTADCTDFVTVITVENDDSDIVNSKMLDDNTVVVGNSSIELKTDRQPDISDLKIEFRGKTLVVDTDFAPENGTLCKLGVVDIKWRKMLLETEFSEEFPINVDLPFYGECAVFAHIKTPDGRDIKGVIGTFRFNQTTKHFDVTTDETNKSKMPRILNSSVRFVSENSAEFSVDLDYFWHYVIQWYVYKDGQCVKWASTTNESSYVYDFTVSGNYYVLYYVVSADDDRLQGVIGNIKVEIQEDSQPEE